MTTECIDHGMKGNVQGYGRSTRNGRKNTLLHRLAYCEANSLELEAIDGQLVLHSCDNPRCINPEHLRLGTHADNMREMSEKRRVSGLKLTADQVRQIRTQCNPNTNQPNDFGYRGFARRFGVDKEVVKDIFLGRCHKYVPSADTGAQP